MKRFYIILAAIVIVILALGTLLVSNWIKAIPDEVAASAVFTPTQADQTGTDINSTFRITFASEVSSASLRRCLSVTPEIQLGVHQGTGTNEVLIAPAEPLSEGTIYTFTLQSESQKYAWSVQTKTPLAVSEVRPGDKETDVFLSQPIEIVLNQLLPVDLAVLDEYLSISPQISYSAEQEGRILRITPQSNLQHDTVYTVELKAGLPQENSTISLTEGISFAFETMPAEQPLWQLQAENAYLSGAAAIFSVQTQQTEDDNTVSAKLYQFSSQDAYADALFTALKEHPSWSNGYHNLHNISLQNTTLQSEHSLELQDGQFSWPQTLANGYYLLRCEYKGQSRDRFFAVSEIAAYMLAEQDQTLFWLHDSIYDQPMQAYVKDVFDDAIAASDVTGVALLPRQTDTVYIISSEGQSLIVPCVYQAMTLADNNANWRYLYLDHESYQQGDTLYFWGMVKPRDGSKMEYERVSVLLYSYDLQQTVQRDYTPLQDDVFSGKIALSNLLPGNYSLQIWQSGKKLLAQDFSINSASRDQQSTANEHVQNNADNAANTAPDNQAKADLPLVHLDKPGYDIGSSFLAASPLAGSEYLFIEQDNKISKYVAGTENSYLGSFAPSNYLNSYISAISYQNGIYGQTAPTLLARDNSDNKLSIKESGDLNNEKSLSSGNLAITVKDKAGNPTAAKLLVTIYNSEEKPQVDTFGKIFADYMPLATEQPAASAAKKQTLFFSTLHTNSEGFASCDYELPAFNGNCWLVVQAIATNDTPLCGSIVVSYGAGTQEEETIESPARQKYAYNLGILEEDTQLAETTALSIFASEQRLAVSSLLWEQLFAYEDNTNSAATAIAASCARSLLNYYAADYIVGIIGEPIRTNIYQKADGGFGDLGEASLLPISVLAIEAAPDNIDLSALTAYYSSFLHNSSSRLEKCMALAGLAHYKQPVLNEINWLLAADDISCQEQLWLLLGLHSAGERQTSQPLKETFAALLQEQENFSAKEAALAAVISSLCGVGDSMQLLQLAVDKGMASEQENTFAIEKVLVARNLLAQELQAEMSFDYQLAGQEQHAVMYGINDFLLNTTEEQPTFSNIEGSVHYLNIYSIDEAANWEEK